MKKRILALLLAMMMVFSLVACGDKESASVDDKKEEKKTEQTTTEEPTTERAKTLSEKIVAVLGAIDITEVNTVEFEITNLEIPEQGTYSFKAVVSTVDSNAKAVVKWAKQGQSYKDLAEVLYVDGDVYVDVASLYDAVMELTGATSAEGPSIPEGYMVITEEEIKTMLESSAPEGSATSQYEELLNKYKNMQLSPILYTALVENVAGYVESINGKLPEGALTVSDDTIAIVLKPENLDGIINATIGSDVEKYAKAYAEAIKDDELGKEISKLILENIDGVNDELANMEPASGSATEENAGEKITIDIKKLSSGLSVKLGIDIEEVNASVSVATKKENVTITAPSNTYTMEDLQSTPIQ